MNIYDLQLRVDALELLLISRGETDRENLKLFRKEAEENHTKKRAEFRREQWGKVQLGSIINYEIYPDGPSLSLEVISISPEPFRYLAGKIIQKNGKSGYHVGDVFTINSPWKLELRTGLGSEIISRE